MFICQFKRWHRDSSIYNLLEISECQSLFLLNLRLLAREVWPFHTIVMLVILWAFLRLFLKCLFCQQLMWKTSLKRFKLTAVLQLSFTAFQKIHNVWCLAGMMVWYSPSCSLDDFPLCFWVPGPLLGLIPCVWVTHSTHASGAPCNTSWHRVPKGPLQLNCSRSLGTDVNYLQHELALARAPPPPHPSVAFRFGYAGASTHRSTWQRVWKPSISYNGR